MVRLLGCFYTQCIWFESSEATALSVVNERPSHRSLHSKIMENSKTQRDSEVSIECETLI
jgi:hypothetical protein